MNLWTREGGRHIKTTRIFIRVSTEEKEQILEKMKGLGMKNLSDYSRQMLLNGHVVKKEYQELRGLTAQIGRLGGNINQIAKRANENRVVPQKDIDEVTLLMRTILRIVKSDVKIALKS